MAVFVASGDESSGKDHRSRFFYGGYVAPQRVWDEWVAPAWEERVLNGPPTIPYLHMTDIRSAKWRSKYALTESDADTRVAEAVRIIGSTGSLCAITSEVDAAHYRDSLQWEMKLPKKRAVTTEPDHYCFWGFAMTTLGFIAARQPDAEKVDFIVERKDGVTKLIEMFHSAMKAGLRAKGWHHLERLVGEIIPSRKDRVPLQAADVLCWHVQRHEAGLLGSSDAARFRAVAQEKCGARHRFTAGQNIGFGTLGGHLLHGQYRLKAK